ncbi:MAG: response regulator [Pseudomonadota bacterium]
MSTPIVHVIDDDEAIRDSIALLLSTVSIACRTYASASDFLERYADAGSCCLVVDIRMPGMSGLELQDELKRRDIDAAIVFITGHGEIDLAVRAMRNGAIDFVQKPFRDQQLLDSVNSALALVEKIAQREDATRALGERYASLTPREREVMRLVAQGVANKNIAYELNVSQRTVEIHRSRVMHKMHARTLADLVRFDIELSKSAGDAIGQG